MRLCKKLVGAMVLACPLTVFAQVPQPEHLSHGRFENVPVLRPVDEPKRVVIWFSSQASATGWSWLGAQKLRDDGALVALVDIQHLYSVLKKDTDDCVFSVGDVENFSRYLQAYYRYPTYRLPLLVGDGDGAALAYAVTAQAPEHVLAGLVTDQLCPPQIPAKSVCSNGVLPTFRLNPSPLVIPWLVAQAQHPQQACSTASLQKFVKTIALARVIRRTKDGNLLPGLQAALRSLGAQPGVSLPPPPADLQGLPVVEVPVQQPGDTFAIFISGDGGWAGIDKKVAENLAAAGIPVVGVDALRYFWNAQTPQKFAKDLDRIAQFYRQRWSRPQIVLVGFSQGADVLPAAYNLLPDTTRSQIRLTTLLSLGKTADYEFHVSNWVSEDDDDGLPVAPEVAKMPTATTVCIYGQDDEDSLCPSLPTANRRTALPGDHHFDGDYQTVAQTLLQQLQQTPH